MVFSPSILFLIFWHISIGTSKLRCVYMFKVKKIALEVISQGRNLKVKEKRKEKRSWCFFEANLISELQSGLRQHPGAGWG